jgi:RNA polymerase sigma factor (sigma-70 family)
MDTGTTSSLAALASPSPPENYDSRLPVVESCVNNLPADCAVLIRLHFFEGLTQVEIATIFGVTACAISRRLKNALGMVSRCVERKGYSTKLSNTEGHDDRT